MATAEQKLVTADQFFLMPLSDGFKVELVQGAVVAACRPGFRHGLRQLRIGGLLDQFGRSTQQGRAVVETGVVTRRGPDTVRGPDISYWSAERLPFDQEPVGYPDTAPDLAVEILSPNNEMAKIRLKMQEYFNRGVRMLWIVDPEDRHVAVYRSVDEGRIFHESATLSGEDVLLGFSCRVAELFD
jgi:Uma2 family endonuclease